MQQIGAVWQALDPRRRVIVVLATLAMFATVLALSRMAGTPRMALLYAGLETAAAGEVVAALEQRAVPYEVRGTAIYVSDAQRDELRMALATDGLPATGGAGYELLDQMTGFGTTSQMFDAAYWRAKEGELARTITANRGVRAARVHIAAPTGSAFRRDQHPTASVTVTTSGGQMSVAQAQALRYLVASAVAGMTPADVAVIDGAGGLIAGGEDDTDGAAGTGGSAKDRAAGLSQGIEHLLEARVGAGRAVVEVSLDTVTEREQITERRFDPQGRVAVSSETEETTTNATGQGTGAVTVASNLPTGDAASGSTGTSSQNSSTRERTNFEISETSRDVLRAPGAVRRITVAVLVDGLREVAADGTETWTPRPDEELAALRELVQSAVGYDEQRGDVITLKSMRFDVPPPAADLLAPGLIESLGLDLMALAQIAVLAIVALVLGMFVLRPILTSRTLPRLPAPIPAGLPPPAALDGEIADAGGRMRNDQSGAMALPGRAMPARGQDTALARDPDADPVARLRHLIDARQDATIETLRNWMEDREETS